MGLVRGIGHGAAVGAGAWRRVLQRHLVSHAVAEPLAGAHVVVLQRPDADQLDADLRPRQRVIGLRLGFGQRLARHLKLDLLIHVQAVEESRGGQARRQGTCLGDVLHVASEDAWVHEEGVHLLSRGLLAKLCSHLLLHTLEIFWLQSVTRTPLEGLQLALQNSVLHLLGESKVRGSHLTTSELNGTLRPLQRLHLLHVGKVRHLDALLQQEERDVADRLRRGRNLHDVPAPLVDVRVHLQYLVPVLGVAERAALGVHVGVLTSRHLVLEDPRGHRLHATLEGTVHVSDIGPVGVQALELPVVDLGVAWPTLHCGDEGVQRRLRGSICEGGEASIHDVASRLRHGVESCELR
mmetsp:Transcript_56399/g.134434  ORF Transcript_56399/g.134434 Transcript_56399/m.134434 type:complete len:352 (-) Transcript_56399:1354-2409(-)